MGRAGCCLHRLLCDAPGDDGQVMANKILLLLSFGAALCAWNGPRGIVQLEAPPLHDVKGPDVRRLLPATFYYVDCALHKPCMVPRTLYNKVVCSRGQRGVVLVAMGFDLFGTTITFAQQQNVYHDCPFENNRHGWFAVCQHADLHLIDRSRKCGMTV